MLDTKLETKLKADVELQTAIMVAVVNILGKLYQSPVGELEMRVHNWFSDWAVECADLALAKPVAKPNVSQSQDWKIQFAQDVESGMLERGFEEKVKAMPSKTAEQFGEDVDGRDKTLFTYVRVGEYAGQIVTMLYHNLDPKLLVIDDDSDNIELNIYE